MFFRFENHIDNRPKNLTFRSPNSFLPTNCPMKIKVIPVHSNWFVLKETAAYKIQGCADLRTHDMNKVK